MIEYRPIDHQSTMGAYVGKIGVKDGKGYMKDWRFVDGKDVLPIGCRDQEDEAGQLIADGLAPLRRARRRGDLAAE